MNLQQLYYFDTMYRVCNYTHAAKKLMITQSSLSHSIANLENELGLPLFEWKNRNLCPTVYADRFERHVVSILEELEEAKREFATALHPGEGMVRLGLSCTMSLSYMPGLMKKFGEIPANSNIRFQLQELTAKYVNDALKEKLIDLGFCAKIEDDALEYVQALADRMILIVPEHSPLAQKKQVSYRELEKENIIIYPYTCGTRYYLDELFRTHGINPQRLSEATTERLIISQVEAGAGVAIIPALEDLQMYHVVPVALEGGKLLRPMYMVWLRNSHQDPAVKAFRKFVTGQIEPRDFS
jgi:DNA-binding transcriptional LysR family regulator